MEGLPVAAVDSGSSSEGINFIHPDALGTPRAVRDSSGAVIWSWAFKGNPFGEAMPTSSTGYVFNLRFPGQYFDAESGLNYNVNRDYEATTGRFLQSDPTGLDDGPSTYDYVRSSPLPSIDPMGLQAVRTPLPAPSFPSAPGTGRVSGFGPPASEPFIPPGAIGAVCGRVLGAVGALWRNTTSACDQPYPPADANCPGSPQCSKATSFQMKQAGIDSAHESKSDYVGKERGSQYDICACRDGSIVLKGVGRCGQPGPAIDTYAR